MTTDQCIDHWPLAIGHCSSASSPPTPLPRGERGERCMPPFHSPPLHVHSHYSLLEGVDSPDALLQRAAACGYPALALTDSNNLYGAVAFVEAAQRHGVRPILGSCLRLGRAR